MQTADIPVAITCRDRLVPLSALVTWLERAGHEEIVLLDNASTYPPLLDYFRATPHDVVRLSHNLGPRVAWGTGLVKDRWASRWYIVTDPDVIPAEECPLDAAVFMHEVLRRHRKASKVGLGLKTDDLPAHYKFAEEVRILESEFYQPDRLVEPHVYRSPVDTTFALYRPGRAFEVQNALRLAAPYVARHAPWYEDSEDPSDDERYYQAHAEYWNNYKPDKFPSWLRSHVERIQRGETQNVPTEGRLRRRLRHGAGWMLRR